MLTINTLGLHDDVEIWRGGAWRRRFPPHLVITTGGSRMICKNRHLEFSLDDFILQYKNLYLSIVDGRSHRAGKLINWLFAISDELPVLRFGIDWGRQSCFQNSSSKLDVEEWGCGGAWTKSMADTRSQGRTLSLPSYPFFCTSSNTKWGESIFFLKKKARAMLYYKNLLCN